MAKREFLMLAQKRKDQDVIGWLESEKLDGMRCFWDGGITRGMLKADVPWANTDKDFRYRDTQYSSGLWSRYGNVLHAPKWWTDVLPKIFLDGELYTKREDRQNLMSIVKKLIPTESWIEVFFNCFDSPPIESIFAMGEINTTNFKKNMKDCLNFVNKHKNELVATIDPGTQFSVVYSVLKYFCIGGRAIALKQEPIESLELLNQKLLDISCEGGEGLVIRNPSSVWVPQRSKNLLKMKKYDDDEGIVVGYITGRETALGSKLLGMLGALVLDYKGQRLELSGFTDQERTLNDPEWARDNPASECPDLVECIAFPRGSKVTFKYRGKSRDGIPQEASYWRKYDNL